MVSLSPSEAALRDGCREAYEQWRRNACSAPGTYKAGRAAAARAIFRAMTLIQPEDARTHAGLAFLADVEVSDD